MIRVLFVVLAVVAMVLAIVLSQPLLYLVAVVLLLAAAAILTAGLRRQHRRESEVVRPPAGEPSEDLRSLGIMEIRAKGSNGSATAPDEEIDEDEESEVLGEPVPVAPEPPPKPESRPKAQPAAPGDGTLFGDVTPARPREERRPAPEPAQAEAPRGDQPSGAVAVRKRARTARIMVEGVSDTFDGEVMLSVLRGLRAALDATTVCLLRQEDGPLAYVVEAIVSRNAFARNGGRFQAVEPMIAGHRAMEAVIHPCNMPGGYEARRLGYYHETIAVHQVAFVPMTGRNGRGAYLLVADSMNDSGLEQAESVRVLEEFARLIHSFVAEGTPGPSRSMPTGVPLRPRREIIADEMEEARTERKPLALALVYLNRAESIGKGGEESIREAENVFQNRLRSVTRDGRVERFGELTYGVFRKAGVEDAAHWASELQARMAEEGGPLAGGVSVGIAMLGDRHDGPDQLRSDATDALRESYETGECIILE